MTHKPLTVVQVLPALQSGGVERGTLEVGKYLAEHGHRSIVISNGGRMVEQLEHEGSEHVLWDIGKKSPWTLRLIPLLRKFLRENQVDILHARSRMPAWVAYLAWKGMDPNNRPRFITTIHGPYTVNRYSAVMTKGERVIVISKMILDYVLTNYPKTDPNKLRLIYRGVDPKEFPYGYQPPADWLTSWYDQYPETKNKILLTLPARITRWKGQEDFLELIARVSQKHPEAHGLIVGETKDRKEEFLAQLKAKAEKLGITGKVTFTGHRNDLREVMAISTIVYSLAREPEAFGRTTIEALSLGKPIIGYDHGGVGEQLKALLPDGLIAVGKIGKATDLTTKWLSVSPKIKTNLTYTLKGLQQKTLELYSDLTKTQ